MLKPANEPMEDPAEGRPIGEIVLSLLDEGKAYAKAEFNLAKATAEAKAAELKVPAILFFAALLFAQAAVTVLAVTVALALATLIGPLAGGLVAFLFTGATAAGLGWIGYRKLKTPK